MERCIYYRLIKSWMEYNQTVLTVPCTRSVRILIFHNFLCTHLVRFLVLYPPRSSCGIRLITDTSKSDFSTYTYKVYDSCCVSLKQLHDIESLQPYSFLPILWSFSINLFQKCSNSRRYQRPNYILQSNIFSLCRFNEYRMQVAHILSVNL